MGELWQGICDIERPDPVTVDSLSNRTTLSFLEDLMGRPVAEAFAGSMIQFLTADASDSSVTFLKSEPFGKYRRSNPFVFSLVPRCQAE